MHRRQSWRARDALLQTLCQAPGPNHPSRGSELCAVVEAMFSYEYLFSVFGDVEFLDRTERIAFNALPATWAR